MLQERRESLRTLMDLHCFSEKRPDPLRQHRLALAFDPISQVEREACGGQGLQRGHAGLQGPVCRGLQALMPFPQHLSNAHHGEPASALDTVGAPQGLRRAVTGPRGWGAHALLFGWAVLIFVSKGDQSGVQRSLERRWASGQQDGRECPLTASQTPRGVQNPAVMGRGEQLCLAVTIHGLEGAHHIQQQGVFLDGQAGAPRPLLRGLRLLHDPGGPGGWHGDELHGGGGHTIGV